MKKNINTNGKTGCRRGIGMDTIWIFSSKNFGLYQKILLKGGIHESFYEICFDFIVWFCTNHGDRMCADTGFLQQS
jgi:hypothetical protein